MLRFARFPSWLRATALAAALLGLYLAGSGLSRASAQDEERARALFQEGNEHLAAGLRAQGARRERELSRAVEIFQTCLGIVRSRNVLFNAGLALTGLGRDMDAYNFFSEYLRVEGLSAEERLEAERRMGELAPRVAVVVIRSEPAGAEVRIDRTDLPSRGQTARGESPLRLAVPEGAHRVLFHLDGYEDTAAEARAAVGASAEATVTLTPLPVAVQILAPSEGELRLDGERIEPGRTLAVAPGSHRVTLHMEGRQPAERRFTLEAGAAPMIFEMVAPPPLPPPAALGLRVVTEAPARIFIDGEEVGTGTEVSREVATERPHRVRVEAEGHWPLSTEVQVPATLPGSGLPAGPRELRVRLAPVEVDGQTIALRAGGLVATGLTALGALVCFGLAMQTRDSYLERPTQEDLELGNNLLLATDVLLAATALFGSYTLFSLTFDDRTGGPSESELVLSPTAGGGLASLRGSFQ